MKLVNKWGYEQEATLADADKVASNDELNSFFKGKSFCITGPLSTYNRDFYIALIEDHGGIYKGAVTQDLDYLIANSNFQTVKMKKAISNGTKIVTETRMLELVKLSAKLKVWKSI